MNKRGQSMIEYAILAMLVILGIVFLGPYVLRSIDAHFKLWDYGAQDSFSEHIQQAPVGDVPDLPINCNCPMAPGNCGSAQAGSLCGATQREWDYNCNILGCNGALGNSKCENDPTCCTALQPLGCGTFPCPASGCPTTTPMPPPTPGNCYYGYELEEHVCGGANSFTQECDYDAQPSGICPLPACQGTINMANTTPCAGSPGTPGGPSMINNAPNNIVTSCPNPVGSCEYTCVPGMEDVNGVCTVSSTCYVYLQNFCPWAHNGCWGGQDRNCPNCGCGLDNVQVVISAQYICLNLTPHPNMITLAPAGNCGDGCSHNCGFGYYTSSGQEGTYGADNHYGHLATVTCADSPSSPCSTIINCPGGPGKNKREQSKRGQSPKWGQGKK